MLPAQQVSPEPPQAAQVDVVPFVAVQAVFGAVQLRLPPVPQHCSFKPPQARQRPPVLHVTLPAVQKEAPPPVVRRQHDSFSAPQEPASVPVHEPVEQVPPTEPPQVMPEATQA